MLRVFSNSLRLIHQQTEKILNKKTETTSSGQGMFAVANAFYNDEEYHISCEILNKVLEKFSSEVNVEQVNALLKDAKLKAEQQAHNNTMLTYANDYTPTTPSVLKQFSLPAFDRFTKNYKKGDVIVAEFEPGEVFYLIKSGEVQIVKTMNTQNKNLDVLKPGEFFGEMAILDNSPRTATCVAKTNVSCLEFNKANFSSLVLGNSVIVMNLLKLFCKRICDQRRRIKIILIPDISVRIADVFIMFDELNKISNVRDELNHKRKFDVTVGEISSWAGISINDARDELNKLVEKRKIEIFDNFSGFSNKFFSLRSSNYPFRSSCKNFYIYFFFYILNSF
jgi:CRP-like cAMP-binding protein